jgi:PAS domain S-box-containing protein
VRRPFREPAKLLEAEHAVSAALLGSRNGREAFLNSCGAVWRILDWQHASLWGAEGDSAIVCVQSWQAPGSEDEAFAECRYGQRLRVGDSLAGRVWATGEPAFTEDLAGDPLFACAPQAADAGLRSAVAFPLEGASGVVAVTEAFSTSPVIADEALLATLLSIGRRVGQFVDKRRALDAVSRSEARKRAILDAALDCIITMDSDGAVVEANAALERVFGWPPHEVVGQEMAELIVPPELREAHRNGLRRVAVGGVPRLLGRRLELVGMHRDGSRFPVELTITQIDRPGRPLFTGHVRDITDRKAAEEELLASRARVVTAADEARRRIERDLHDGAQQQLIAVQMALRMAEDRVRKGKPDALELLGEARAELERATAELRELARGIHPAMLTEGGLAAALPSLTRRASIPVSVEIDVPERPAASVEAAAYFLVAEALANVERHSGASQVEVSAVLRDGLLHVRIADDGRGGEPGGGGSGLRGLADRLAALDGALEVVTAPGEGFELRATLPCTV